MKPCLCFLCLYASNANAASHVYTSALTKKDVICLPKVPLWFNATHIFQLVNLAFENETLI